MHAVAFIREKITNGCKGRKRIPVNSHHFKAPCPPARISLCSVYIYEMCSANSKCVGTIFKCGIQSVACSENYFEMCNVF